MLHAANTDLFNPLDPEAHFCQGDELLNYFSHLYKRLGLHFEQDGFCGQAGGLQSILSGSWIHHVPHKWIAISLRLNEMKQRGEFRLIIG